MGQIICAQLLCDMQDDCEKCHHGFPPLSFPWILIPYFTTPVSAHTDKIDLGCLAWRWKHFYSSCLWSWLSVVYEVFGLSITFSVKEVFIDLKDSNGRLEFGGSLLMSPP